MSSLAHQSQYGLEGYRPYEHHQRVILYSRPWHIAKIVMRGSNIVFSLIVVGLSAYLSVWRLDGLFLIFSGFPAAVAVIWDTAELIAVCARVGRRGIHSGAHVGLHLIFWLIFARAVGIQSTYVYFRDEPDSYASRRLGFIQNKIIPMQNAVLEFTIPLLTNHFILFVRSCIETNQRNHRPPVFMVPIAAPPMQPQMVAGAYVPYPHHAYVPAQQSMGQQGKGKPDPQPYTPPEPDGTYYAPSGQAR